jgi:hypothetical protein
VYITVHQDAGFNSPIVGWAIENGTPSKNDFLTDARFLELTVLGNAEHPTRCAVIMEHITGTEPDEDPAFDDPGAISDSDPKTETSYTIPCSESENSTRITWPDGSIVMTGHIEDTSSSGSEDDDSNSASDNPWSFHIDEITRAPHTTRFDPEGSFSLGSPAPSSTAT